MLAVVCDEIGLAWWTAAGVGSMSAISDACSPGSDQGVCTAQNSSFGGRGPEASTIPVAWHQPRPKTSHWGHVAEVAQNRITLPEVVTSSCRKALGLWRSW